MKTVDAVLKQNRLNALHQPGFFQEAHHRVAIIIEFIAAPMQMVLPRCETSLKLYDTVVFGEHYKFPENEVKLQKIIEQFRRYTDRDLTDTSTWTDAVTESVVAQALGPMGLDNEALEKFGFQDKRWSNANPAQPTPTFSPFKATSVIRCNHCDSNLHDGAGCIVNLMFLCKDIGEKLVTRCTYEASWKDCFHTRNMDKRPHVGTALAQVAQSSTAVFRERSVDTILQCQNNVRLSIICASEYSESFCHHTVMKVTNKPEYISAVRHLTVGLVPPRSNSIAGGRWYYRYNSPGLVEGFYWQFNSDAAQLLNSTEHMKAALATRQGWYKAIALDTADLDKTTRDYQQALRDTPQSDNWRRKADEFIRGNLLLWSKYMECLDNSAESFISRPDRLPSSDAYKRRLRQRIARHYA